MIVTAAGLVVVPNIVAAAGFIALLAALEAQVRGVEEPYLRAAHGASHETYAANVGRCVPGVGRLTAR
ncbi:MAG TPA: hypothetical protein VM143_14685 [Acidimicrobiales bacterium]|nr:hypothetical protein [Acidimicrobiales bacterium]